MKKVTVSYRGQIALPAAILRQSGIRPGDHLLVSNSNGHIVLKREEEDKHSQFGALMRSIWNAVAESGRHDREAKLLESRQRDVRTEARGLRRLRHRSGSRKA